MLGQSLEEQQPPLKSLKLAACGAVPQSPTQQHHHLQAPHTYPDMSSMQLAFITAFGTMFWLVLVHPHVCSSALFDRMSLSSYLGRDIRKCITCVSARVRNFCRCLVQMKTVLVMSVQWFLTAWQSVMVYFSASIGVHRDHVYDAYVTTRC